MSSKPAENNNIVTGKPPERNFRSAYYEKVGCHSVEEKKSLNKLLSENYRDYKKLKQFCLSYSVPGAQRAFLFQLILRILPLCKQNTEYVQSQVKDIFNDLLRAVKVIQNISLETAPNSQIMLYMWKCEQNRLLQTNATAERLADDKNFEEVVKVLLKVFDDDCEVYWISKEFFCLCLTEIKNIWPKLNSLTQELIREDSELYAHLVELDVFTMDNPGSPLKKWYVTCFAGVIEESSLIKVWDKICGGSKMLVVFVFLETVKMFRKAILKCRSLEELENFVTETKEQDNALVNKAIKSWYNSKDHNEIT